MKSGFRVLFECHLLRFWFRARAGFGARLGGLVRFWRFGARRKFDLKDRSGCLIVVRIEECHD